MGLRQWRREVIVLMFVLIAALLRGADAYRDEELQKISHFESGRILEESGNISNSILARRTERVDPLDDLKKYKGGFNITNKHYWSSAIFTGKFGYIIGAAWLIGGIVYAAILLISSLCFGNQRRCERKSPNSFKRKYTWSLLLAISLTLLAIIASGVALGSSSRFHSRAMIVKRIVVKTANNASGTIYTMTEAVENLQNGTELGQNVENSGSLESASKKLNDEARRIERKAKRIMHWVSIGLNILNAVTIVTISLNLVVILALLALDEYKQNPEKSTLSSILPCNDRGSAATILHDVGGRIYDLIDEVNLNLTSLKSSFPEIEYICNPFSGSPEYNYTDNCSSDTIRIGQIPQMIEKFACSGSDGGGCEPGEFIPAHVYGKVQLYAHSMQDILDSYPVIKSLINCQLVKDAFSNILFNHCKPLKKYVHMSWASLAALSTIMVILILMWESESHKKHKFRSSDGSVKPSSTPADSIEVDAAEPISNHIAGTIGEYRV